jgi:hypothetical protein
MFRRPITSIAVVGLMLMAACGGGSSSSAISSSPRPSSPAKLTILSPTNGEVVHGTTLTLKLSLKNAEIVPATTTHIVPTQGHIHVYLDGQIVGMNYALTDQVSVTPGSHLLTAEFVASDHLPFDPRVQAGVDFTVKP